MKWRYRVYFFLATVRNTLPATPHVSKNTSPKIGTTAVVTEALQSGTKWDRAVAGLKITTQRQI